MNESKKTDIRSNLIDILSKLFSYSGIDREMLEYVDLIDDLGMDSIIFISLVIELEAKFSIQIPDDCLRMERYQTFNQIYESLATILGENEVENGNVV